MRLATADQAHAMLEPPIRNLGVAGIRKAASEIPRRPSAPEEAPAPLAGAVADREEAARRAAWETRAMACWGPDRARATFRPCA